MQHNVKIIVIGFFIAMTAAGASASVKTSTDWILPNAKVTPGSLNPDVTQANIKDNICKANWTSTVRPSVSYTNNLKATQMAGSYKYLISTFGSLPANYEEDHLISLQLGGSPTDSKNLWPQPYSGNNAHRKDVIETKLKFMICSGKINLSDAQKAIATDWVAAYNKYTSAADIKTVDSNGN